MEPTSLPKLLTVPEVAKQLHINQNTVHDLRKAGLIPFLKLGAYKCRPAAVEKFLVDYEGYDITDPYHPIRLEG